MAPIEDAERPQDAKSATRQILHSAWTPFIHLPDDSPCGSMQSAVTRSALIRVFFAACVCGIAVSAQQASPSAQKLAQPAFRAGIDVVSLNVTVTDGMSRFVTDLELPEFSVYEDGVKQEVTFFNRRQQPIALSLLLDTSASMEQHLPMLQVAATNFVKRLKPSDIAQVIDFDSRVEIRQGSPPTRPTFKRRSTRRSPAGRPRCTTRFTSLFESCVRSKRLRKRTSAVRH